jgi:hypothetical protein
LKHQRCISFDEEEHWLIRLYQSKAHMFKEEIVGNIEKNNEIYDVYATANIQYDMSRSKLIMDFDHFLRIRDASHQEKLLDESWIPRRSHVEYSVEDSEITFAFNKAFDFWTKQIHSAIFHSTFSDGKPSP